MFDILFGWRKASKCKKLIRRVQCRLKLLKNKRSTIVRQLREDLAELLRHGHAQTAFDRVEQLFKDECLVAVYDLLDQFCEFIIINLPYIRRNKDCPNDINEAVSSIIFASARFGDLPELISIRKLFGERYGQRLATSALELLPGNLVNRQIKEKVIIKSVPDDVKSRLVEDILRSSLQSGPLLLEYSSEKQQKLANESSGDPFPSTETICEQNEAYNLQKSNATTEEGKIVYVDFSSVNKSIKDLFPPLLSSKTTFPTTYSVVLQQTPLQTVDSTVHKSHLGLVSSARKIRPCNFEISNFQQLEEALVVYNSALGHKERSAVVVESSSDRQLPEEIIYLDDIQEIQSPLSKEGNLQDQRLFKFKQSVLPATGKTHDPNDEAPDQDQYDSDDEKAASRRFRKSRNIGSGKRQRRRSVSGDATSINDVDCAIYYGESCNSSPDYDQKSRDKNKDQKKVPIKRQHKVYYAQEIPMHSPFIKVNSFNFVESDHTKSGSRCSSNNIMLNNCSLLHPCYFRTCDEKDDWNCSPQNPNIQYELCHCHCSCNKNPKIQETEKGVLPNQATNKSEDASSPPLLIPTSSGINSPSTSKEEKPSYSRARTMPPERPKDADSDNMLRSNSFPFTDPESSANRHVHPKLPDYDELVAKFMALKKANLQK